MKLILIVLLAVFSASLAVASPCIPPKRGVIVAACPGTGPGGPIDPEKGNHAA
ncbi:MAG: hypothetical protein HY072_01785 [Deltaproteobacteria bacterium]|nr:hypothetical protein [Deltaproteobacteria bacterium]